MTACASCGSNVGDGDQFCGVCGTPATASAETATTVTVDVPEWLTADWGSSAKWAGAAALVALVAHYAVLLVLYLGINVASGFESTGIDWGEFLLIPVRMMLGMHGAVEGAGIWITAVLWIVGSLYVTYRAVAADSFSQLSAENKWAEAGIRAVKVALIYAAIIIVGIIVFEPGFNAYQALFAPSFSSNWNAASGFFFTLLIVALGAGYLLLTGGRGRRGTGNQPSIWTAGFSGTWRILLISIGGLFTFFFIAALLELISQPRLGFAQVLGGLLLILVALLAWAVVDVGLFFMAEAMRFFSDNGDSSEVYDAFQVGDNEGWFLVATLIVAAAFAVGGWRAARLTGSREFAPLIQAAGIAGGGVAVTYLLGTALLGDALNGLSAGIGLSILWTLVAIGGALLYAQSAGILQKVNINVQRPGAATPPASGHSGACPSCGAARTEDHVFCASCGTRF